MTAFTDLIINDGQSTPVARTFKAKALIDGMWNWWYEVAGSAALGYPSIKSKTTFSRNPNGGTRHEFQLRIPVLDVSTPASPKVGHFHQCVITITTADRGTAAERSDLLAYVKNFLASSRASEIVVGLDPPR